MKLAGIGLMKMYGVSYTKVSKASSNEKPINVKKVRMRISLRSPPFSVAECSIIS